jgi:LmbE family N-acetylglucosaminyl deacetylase
MSGLSEEYMTSQPGTWDSPQKILVILAHPDDPEFFCGATLARWVLEGHEIHYLLLTCGDKGGGLEYTPAELCTTRHAEQHKAGAIIGVRSIQFLSHEDGYLVPDLALRKEVVRAIRRNRPDILVTCDPTNLFPFPGYGLNHPDHRAAGQVVLDAAFPAAGNVHYFPELLKDEGLEPHTPREAWISLTAQPSVIFDVTGTWDIKLKALMEHRSQIGDPLQFEARMRSRHTEDSSDEHPRFEEKFHVVKFRRP